MLDMLRMLGKVHMVDCSTSKGDGSALYGPSMMAALFQVLGSGARP